MTKKINVRVRKNPDEKFEVINDQLVSLRVSRDFTIETEKGDIIVVNKYAYDGEDVACEEGDYDIIDGNNVYKKMSEEDQDAFYDFVQELEVIR